MQTITSVKTSRNIIPAGIKTMVIRGKHHGLLAGPAIVRGMSVLDYGGGRYDKAVDYVAKHGATLRVYDPFSRSMAHNIEAVQGTTHLITCMNVLNVLQGDRLTLTVISQLHAHAVNKDCPVAVCVYEGDGLGVGKVTRDGYQRNQRLAYYRGLLRKYFKEVKQKGKVLYCLTR